MDVQVLRAIHPFPAFVNAHLGILLHRKFLRRVKAGHGNDDGDHKGAAGAEGDGKRASLSKAPPTAASPKVTAAAPPAPGTRGRRVSDATKSVVGMVAFDGLSDDAWTPVDDKEGGEDNSNSSSDGSSSEDSDSYDSDSSSSGDARSDADYDALRSGGTNQVAPTLWLHGSHAPSPLPPFPQPPPSTALVFSAFASCWCRRCCTTRSHLGSACSCIAALQRLWKKRCGHHHLVFFGLFPVSSSSLSVAASTPGQGSHL